MSLKVVSKCAFNFKWYSFLRKEWYYALFGIVILKSSISVLFYSHKTVRRTISQCVALYNCEAISLAARRIKLRECPQDTHALARLFFLFKYCAEVEDWSGKLFLVCWDCENEILFVYWCKLIDFLKELCKLVIISAANAECCVNENICDVVVACANTWKEAVECSVTLDCVVVCTDKSCTVINIIC